MKIIQKLKYLEQLKYLDLLGNRLEKLPSDLFENTPSLMEVVFNNNRIKFIGSEILSPLKNLEIINFGGNICIGGRSRTLEEMQRLNAEIKLKCSDISMFDLMFKLSILEEKINSINRVEKKPNKPRFA